VVGAAVATSVSRYVELAVVVVWTHSHRARNPFIVGAYRSFRVPRDLTRRIIVKGMPLLVNEFLWSTGMAFMSQCYSTRGLEVVAAFNIATTINQLSNVVFLSLGNSVGILMGQMLGAGLPEEQIRRDNSRMIRLCVLVCFAIGGATVALSGLFPRLYNTTDSVRHLATWFIIISSCAMPLQAYIFPVYFTLRSGGKTVITFLFDCGSIWALSIPLAFCLSNFTPLPILAIYVACHSIDIIKCVVGYFMIKNGSWIQNLTVK